MLLLTFLGGVPSPYWLCWCT